MKLLIILSVIACSHAAKLDRTYLPPASAASAGGSHDSLRTPVSQFGSAGNFGPSSQTGAFAPSGSAGSLASLGSRGSSGSTGSFRPSGSQFGLPNNGAFGKNSGALNQPLAPSSQYGQPSGASFDTNFAEPARDFGTQNFGSQAQNFGNQAQNYQRNQQKASADINAEILRLDNQNDGETFSYNFETSNGIAAEESGVATNGVQAQGAYSYSDDDGQQFRVAYTADENGYQPQGEHLPTPHPIPEEILKSIEQNARAAAAGTQEGAYNPEEDNTPTSPQAYNYNAPTSYNQRPAGQSSTFNQGSTSSSGTFNQARENTPGQTYGAPNAASPSRYQNPQGPSQQYGAPTAGFSPKSQGPAQQYDALSGSLSGSQRYLGSAQQNNAPHGGSSARLQGPSQQYGAPDASPSRSNNLQSPSQQYGAPNAGSAVRQSSFNQHQANIPSAVYGSASNGAARPSNFNGNQGANGFGPSGSAFRPSGFPNSQAKSNQYQTRPNQYSQPKGPTASGQAQEQSGYQYNKPHLTNPSFGPANARQGQGQYRPQNQVSQGSQGGFPTSSGGGPSESIRPAFQPSQNYGAAAVPNAVGSKGSFGSTGQSSFGSPARPNTQSFGQPQGQSFNQGFNQQQSQMSESGYQYNQPQGSQNFGSRGSQTGFKTTPSQGQTFGVPRQPPSFTEEEGYKY